MADRSEIGRRVAYWRTRRGFSQRQFAELVERSISWVEGIESGRRNLHRLPMLDKVAEVLGVPVAVLTDDEQAERAVHGIDATEVTAMRQALQRYQAVCSTFHQPSEAQPFPRLQRQVAYLWTAFQHCDYPALGTRLPELIRQAQDTVAVNPAGSDNGRTARMLASQAYQLAASTLYKLTQADLAWIAAERAIGLAEQTEDKLLISDAARRVAQGLMATGNPAQALELIHADIARLEPGSGTTDVGYLSMYGMQFLMGAVVAARQRSSSQTRELIRDGRRIADRLGADHNAFWSAFGPTNVALHHVSVSVDLDQHAQAISIAERVDRAGLALMPTERRAHFHLDVARAHAMIGHGEQAVDRLLEAERLAAHEVYWRPPARDLIAQLVRTGSPPVRLRELADRAGLSA